MNKEIVVALLEDKGISPSYQRIRILQYLMGTKSHPTVDNIYKELIGEIPTLSKTTVYNTLNLFMEKGIVTVITIEEGEARYDADITLHGHFKCQKCGKVEDFPLELENNELSELEGYGIKEKHVYYRGICKECKT